MFTIKIEYDECVKPYNRHIPPCFNDKYKTLTEAVKCVYDYFSQEFTEAQNKRLINMMPCQKEEISSTFDAMVEAFDKCSGWLYFGDFYIRINKK
jgi:hypothetical protein